MYEYLTLIHACIHAPICQNGSMTIIEQHDYSNVIFNEGKYHKMSYIGSFL